MDFSRPESPKVEETVLQSAWQQRLRVWELTKQCPAPCSEEAAGQRNPDEQLQSRHWLTCWTKTMPS